MQFQVSPVFFVLIAALSLQPLCAQTPPFITTHPQSQSVCEGDALTLTVVAGPASAMLVYSWSSGGVIIPGATTDTLTIPTVTPADAGVYQVSVNTSFGGPAALSNPATIDVLPSAPPVITSLDPAEVVPGTWDIRVRGTGFTNQTFISVLDPCGYPRIIPPPVVISSTEIVLPQILCEYGGDPLIVLSNPCPAPGASASTSLHIRAPFPVPLAVQTSDLPDPSMIRLTVGLERPIPFSSAVADYWYIGIDGNFGPGYGEFVPQNTTTFEVDLPRAWLGSGPHTLSFQSMWDFSGCLAGNLSAPSFPFTITEPRLSIAQPAGSTSLGVAISGGLSLADSFTCFSFDPANSTAPGQGLWLGLHTSFPDFLAQAQIPAAPWRSTLDGSGSSLWTAPQGFLVPSLAGMELFGVSATWDSTQSRTTPVAGMLIPSPTAYQLRPQASPISSAWRHSTLTDFNGDGVLDLSTQSDIRLGLGNGDFSAAQHWSLPTGSIMSAADLDADGFTDLIVADPYLRGRSLPSTYGSAPSFGSVRILYGNATGTFTNAPELSLIAEVPSDGRISTEDLNSDGFPDLVISSGRAHTSDSLSPSLQVFLTTAPRTYTSQSGFGPTNETHALGDFNGDGHTDVLSTSTLLLGNSLGTFTPGTALPPIPASQGIPTFQSLDTNNDGADEIAIATSNRLTISTLTPQGTWTTQTIAPITPGPTLPSLTTLDWNNDGYQDLITATFEGGTGYARIFLNPGPTSATPWKSLTIPGSSTFAGFVRTADLNQYTVLDILIGGSPLTVVER